MTSTPRALFAIAATALLAPGLAAAKAAPSPPALRLPADVRPLSYELALRIDPAAEGFSGRVVIAVELAQETSFIWLNATDLEAREARVSAGEHEQTANVVAGGRDFLGLELAAPIGPGRAEIAIDYSGRFELTDTFGLFKQKVGDDWYVFSQFEATDARRAVPSFDEPGFKVPWSLELSLPEALVGVSNARVVAESEAVAGFKTLRFAPTAALPSYLVAIGVGPFDVVDFGEIGAGKVRFRVLTPRGRRADAAHAGAITPELVAILERYFGTPYPFDKLDYLAIPQTVGFGAMENAGLITFSESLLLATPRELTASFRRRLATVAAHELAHQWFGDLVTLEFWDDVWLNEAFASWLEEKVVSEWKPEWQGDVSSIRSRSWAMGSDALVSARKIRQPIASSADIENAFDGITYEKGAAVIAMFERWLGPERFQSGVRRYLKQHAGGNATSEDFLAALAAEDARLGPAFKTFLDQPGVPLVTAELDCSGEGHPRLRLAQRRFLPEGSQGSSEAIWTLPVCVRYPAGEGEGHQCTLLDKPTAEIELAGEGASGCPGWLVANAGADGYYRVSYRGELLERLLADGAERLSLRERVALLDDVSALVKAGELPMAEVLGHVPQLAADASRHVQSALASIVEELDSDLVPAELKPNYRRFVIETFGARAHELGFVAAAGEDEEMSLLRRTLVGLVADAGEDPALGKAARELAERWLKDRGAVDADMVSIVLDVAAASGDAALFDGLRAAAATSSDRQDRRRALGALGAFRDPALVSRALELVLDDAFDVRESMAILWTALDDEATRELAYGFAKQHFEAIASRIPEESGPRLARLATAFCDAPHRADAEAFLSPRLARFKGSERRLAQALERVSLCIARREAQQASVASFLSQY